MSFEHVKYRNLICIVYTFPGNYKYFAMQFFSSEKLSQLKLYRSLILIQCLTMLKLSLLLLKNIQIIIIEGLWEEKIKVSRKLDVFVKHRCLWPQQSPYEGKHSARHEYSLLLHFHNSYTVIISCC